METSSLNTIDRQACQAFQSAWGRGLPQPIEHFLPDAQHPNYLATLEELVHIEMELKWKAPRIDGEPAASRPPRVEDYIVRFPCLNLPTILKRLVENENHVRQRYGDQPTVNEYRARFPGIVVTGDEIECTIPVSSSGDERHPCIPG